MRSYSVEICSFDDVKRLWSGVRSAPGRTEGRQHYHEERYYLGLYMLALGTYELLTYPFQVAQAKQQHESPDFMLQWPSGQVTGLEVTRATEEPFQEYVMDAAERMYSRRKAAAAISGETTEPVSILLSEEGWIGDEAEVEWCSFVRKAIEKKLKKLSGFKPASRHDLVICDDTPLPAVNRRKVIAALHPWVSSLKANWPQLGIISIIISLDVVFDVGDSARILPYVNWAATELEAPDESSELSERIEYVGWHAVKRALRKPGRTQGPVYFMDSRGRLMKQMADGRRFKVRVKEDGEEEVIEEVRKRPPRA